jgi:hypothetical protein
VQWQPLDSNNNPSLPLLLPAVFILQVSDGGHDFRAEALSGHVSLRALADFALPSCGGLDILADRSGWAGGANRAGTTLSAGSF